MENLKKRNILLCIDAKQFDTSHPLWKTVTALDSVTEEMHIFVFSSKKKIDPTPFISEHTFVYHIPNYFFSKIQVLWKALSFHLRWGGSTRPDIVFSYVDIKNLLWVYFCARIIRRPFFVSLRSSWFLVSKFSFRYWITRYLLLSAAQTISVSEQMSERAADYFSIKKSFVVPLPFVPEDGGATVLSTDLRKAHPLYTFFISAVATDRSVIKRSIDIYKLIIPEYPHTALILIVPEALYFSTCRYVKKTLRYGIFVHKLSDESDQYIKSAHVFLGVPHEQDLYSLVTRSLQLGVPTVSAFHPALSSLFEKTAYEQFMVSGDNPALCAQSIISLIEDQRLRTEYHLNAVEILKKAQAHTYQEYALSIAKAIERYFNPIEKSPLFGKIEL